MLWAFHIQALAAAPFILKTIRDLKVQQHVTSRCSFPHFLKFPSSLRISLSSGRNGRVPFVVIFFMQWIYHDLSIIKNNLILTSPGYFSKNCWDPVSNCNAEAVDSSYSLREALPEEPLSLTTISWFLCQAPLQLLTHCVLVMLTELEMKVSPLFMLTCRKTTLKHKTDTLIFSVIFKPIVTFILAVF